MEFFLLQKQLTVTLHFVTFDNMFREFWYSLSSLLQIYDDLLGIVMVMFNTAVSSVTFTSATKLAENKHKDDNINCENSNCKAC